MSINLNNHFLVTASRSSDGVRLRDEQTNVALSRSHGDSGIDADGISIGSLSDYLNQISSRTAFSASKSSTFADPGKDFKNFTS